VAGGGFHIALLYGLGASAGLVLGGLIGARAGVPRPVLAVALAFASGALIAAFAFELVEKPFHVAGPVVVGVSLIAGAAVFVAVDTLIERLARGETGAGLLAGVTLDGVPENLALGTSVAAGAGSLVLLVSIFVSNFPEALSGAADMRGKDRSPRSVAGIWLVTAALLTLATLGGWLISEAVAPHVLAALQAFAGGAVLASLADTVMPGAYSDGGPWIAFATAAGFLLAFLLSTI
jgi:zinc transporter, ZIP family